MTEIEKPFPGWRLIPAYEKDSDDETAMQLFKWEDIESFHLYRYDYEGEPPVWRFLLKPRNDIYLYTIHAAYSYREVVDFVKGWGCPEPGNLARLAEDEDKPY